MRRLLILTIGLLLLVIPITQAQEAVELDLPIIADGDVVAGAFEEEITAQLYAFYASAGDLVRISMTQEDDLLDPFIVVMDTEGAVLAYDDDSGELNYSALIDAVEIEEDGLYYVMATSFLFVDGTEDSTADVLAYELAISGQTTPETIEDPATITLETDLLNVGARVSGETTLEAPLAFFYINSGQSITISLDEADFFTVLQVFAPDGTRVAVDPSYAEVTLEEDGVYVIVATGFSFFEAMEEDGLAEVGTFVLTVQ